MPQMTSFIVVVVALGGCCCGIFLFILLLVHSHLFLAHLDDDGDRLEKDRVGLAQAGQVVLLTRNLTIFERG
jgi:hypothetical protein